MRSQTQKYKTLIEILEKYINETVYCCDIIVRASTDCSELIYGDPSVEKNKEKLQRYVENIKSKLETIYGIIGALKEDAIEGVPTEWYLEQHPEWYDER